MGAAWQRGIPSQMMPRSGERVLRLGTVMSGGSVSCIIRWKGRGGNMSARVLS
jgi:hypothetical protein